MGFRLPKTKESVRREAAHWLARLRSGRDPDIQGKFHQWRDADPRHSEAFNRVQRTYEQAGLLRHSPMGATRFAQPAIRKHESKRRPAFAAAAALAILVPAVVVLLRDRGAPFAATDAVMLVTSVGEIRQVSLADGSRVTLDTATKVEVEIAGSRRSAHLKYGRARFQVVPGKRPFVVDTLRATVVTGEGVIDVEQVGDESRVQVLAGAAGVRGSGQTQGSSASLGPGQAVIVSPAGQPQKEAAPAAPDWTRGMLQFNGTSLADAAALANRYSQRHIVLLGDVAALRVTGAFRAGDTAGLARSLAAAFSLSLEQRADGDLVLSPSAPSAAPK